MILRASRKEERVHAVEICEYCGRGASLFGRGKRLAIRLRILPCAAQFGVRVKDSAEVIRLAGRNEGFLWALRRNFIALL
jgi:hypothetical protein